MCINKDIVDIQDKIALLEKKIQKNNSNIVQLNSPKPQKIHNPIYEVFQKHRDFIEDKRKRCVTVDKNTKRPVIKEQHMAIQLKNPLGLGPLELQEPEKRLFSPNFGVRRRLNISNPRTVMNDFSVHNLPILIFKVRNEVRREI